MKNKFENKDEQAKDLEESAGLWGGGGSWGRHTSRAGVSPSVCKFF